MDLLVGVLMIGALSWLMPNDLKREMKARERRQELRIVYGGEYEAAVKRLDN